MQTYWFMESALVASLAMLLIQIDQSLCKKSKNEKAQGKNSVVVMQEKPTGGCTSNYDVDYLVMSLTWIPGYCSSKGSNKQCSRPVKQDFSIHGFWPAQLNADSPNNCCTKERYDNRVLQPLDAKLKAHWGSMDGRHPGGFWEYQWRKHGNCAHKVPALRTVFRYFEATLNLYQKLKLKLVLGSRGYTPDNQTVYSGKKILDDLENIYGARFAITCDVWKKDQSKLVISEFRICTNNKLELIDCSGRDVTRRRCLGLLVLPST